jgi:hypothetical protein
MTGTTRSSLVAGAALSWAIGLFVSAMTILMLRSFIDDWFGTIAVFGIAAVTTVSMLHPRQP